MPLVGRARTPEYRLDLSPGFLDLPDPSQEIWTGWMTPPTAHGEQGLVVPERLVSYLGPFEPATGPLDVSDYRGKAYSFGYPLVVWQACRWDELAAGDIVRWRNPDRTLDDRISVVLAPAVPIQPSEGYWQVRVDDFRNGYRVKGFACRFRWQSDAGGEVWLVPEDEPWSKGGSLVALYRVESERAIMHWDLDYIEQKVAEALGV